MASWALSVNLSNACVATTPKPGIWPSNCKNSDALSTCFNAVALKSLLFSNSVVAILEKSNSFSVADKN